MVAGPIEGLERFVEPLAGRPQGLTAQKGSARYRRLAEQPDPSMQPEPLSLFEPRAVEVAATIADAAQRALFEAAVGRVDVRAHLRLQEKYRSAALKSDPAFIYKYLDVSFWLKDKVAKVFSLGLADAPGLRILDLGTGAGHFSALCDALGHEAVGVDLEVPLYVDLCALMGVDRRTYRVKPGERLPSSLGVFDLITAFAIKFDALGVDAQGRHLYWNLADWNHFIGDVSGDRIRYPGRLYLQLNSRILADGSRERFTDVVEACRATGAAISPNGEILFLVDAPISLPVT
jgi:2-polyprenyl-3-methyl-5-hydroxy-6-metoxy-1,4-benzoquinol methylase